MPIALITGATRGIGYALARELSQRGFTVLLGARDMAKGMHAADTLRSEGLEVTAVEVDLERSSTLCATAQFIAEQFGVLDVLVNNAGIMVESKKWDVNTTPTVSPDVLRRTFQVNFFGAVELSQHVLGLLKRSANGRIVNISSILGSLTYHATPDSNTYNTKTFAYNSSKTALNAFTIHLAHALRHTRIKVLSVHPGWVKSELGGEGALITPEQAARPIADLITTDDPPIGVVLFRGKHLPW